MTEGDGKTTKAQRRAKKDADASVLGNLPSTRPNRLGRKRDGAAGDAAEGTKTPAPRKPAGAKAGSASKPRAAAKPKATAGAKPSRVSAPKTGGASARKDDAAPAPKSRKPKTSRGTPNPSPRDRSDQGGPQPVRAGAPALKADAPEDRGPEPQSPPAGAELVGTVVQAAGELAKIGLTVGGQVLKRAVDRLPRP